MILTDFIKENSLIAKEYKELLKISYQSFNNEDRKLIRLAFNTSVDAHKNQRRRSGEPYVFHPIAVAKIVASKIGLDATCIASALLHDVIEDTDYTESKIQKLFGRTIARIVMGLTKISKLGNVLYKFMIRLSLDLSELGLGKYPQLKKAKNFEYFVKI